MTDIALTTDEDAEVLLRAARARKALTVATRAVAQLRSLAVSGGRIERGVEIPEAKTPLLSAITDQADETYAVLLEWVGYFADEFGEPSPAGDAPIAWRMFQASHRSEGYADAPIAGFKPGTTAHDATVLIRSLTSWLIGHLDRIVDLPSADAFYSEISDSIWAAHGQARMSARTVTDASPRPCPDCGTMAVVAEYFREPLIAPQRRGEFDIAWTATADERRDPTSTAGRKILAAVDGVTVRCQLCGWFEIPKAGLVMRWLIGAEPTKSTRQWQDTTAEYWTITQSALHFGFDRRTIEKYIRQGLPVYEGGLIRPYDVIEHWKQRINGRPRKMDK